MRPVAFPDTMGASGIKVSVLLRPAEVNRAGCLLFLYRARVFVIGYFILWCVLIGLILFSSPASDLSRGTLQAAAVLAAAPVLVIGAIMWNARPRRPGGQPPEPMHYHLCPSSLEIRSPRRSGWLPWEALSEVIETSESFLVFLTPQEHYIIPKRCFQDGRQVAAARELLREQMAGRARLLSPPPPPPG